MWSRQVLLVLVCLQFTWCQESSRERECGSKATCHDCVQTPGCAWCSSPKNSSLKHCFAEDINGERCEGAKESPSNEQRAEVDVPLTDVILDKTQVRPTEEQIIQIAPQQIRLKLRRGVPINVSVTYRQAQDYPVDLYYLMDLSKSMEDDKANLAQLGKKLATTMRNLTKQFRLGFGSFVDKVMLPFVNTHPVKLQSPCTGCAAPYSFKNNLKLNENDDMFKIEVENAPISGNLDSPEGGFDALMQVMVCKNHIGWRDQARHLVVFSTDATFHFAGDGKLAGVITPNTGECLLDENQEYHHYHIYDYPSIGQINEKAQEHGINIIFAVSRYEELYAKLSSAIQGSSSGLLDEDSQNIVHLVKEQYDKISSSVELRDDADEADVSLRYFAVCPGDSAARLSSRCGNIREGDEIHYTIEVQLNRCPLEQKSFEVKVTTLHDVLNLVIEPQCDCDCEKQGAIGQVHNSPRCNGTGTEQCGICYCNEGYSGKQCQCRTSGGGTGFAVGGSSGTDESPCTESGLVCNGRGECKCGFCECFEGIEGLQCECDKRKCMGERGLVCSGHGSCPCDECSCHGGWTGPHCECPDESTCRAPGKNEVCSGHGKCRCGECKCDSDSDIPYTGKYCEDCPVCESGKCVEFKDCVQCKIFNTGPKAGDECVTDRKCDLYMETVPSLEEDVTEGARLCTFVEEESNCEFNFTYKYNPALKSSYYISVQNKRVCPQMLSALSIVFGVIGAIVATGLLTLLIWKAVVTMHDRREYEKFRKEIENAKFGTNISGIYKAPVNTFANPAFTQQGTSH